MTASLASADPSPRNEIQVTLFGQPCLLQGPLDPATLKSVHEISPEQLYPAVTAEELQNPGLAAQLKSSLAKLANPPRIPPELDRYRERAAKRLNAVLDFHAGYQAARKQKQAGPLIAAAKPHFKAREMKSFEALARKTVAAKADASRELLEQLFETYSESIEADPEEEFHRATTRLGIKYACAYEESTESGAHGDGGAAQ